eukprot:582269-Pelagomonas_calceolata.AAC.2
MFYAAFDIRVSICSRLPGGSFFGDPSSRTGDVSLIMHCSVAPLWCKGVQRGVCVHGNKSMPCAHGCGPQGIVKLTDLQASCGYLAGHVCMSGCNLDLAPQLSCISLLDDRTQAELQLWYALSTLRAKSSNNAKVSVCLDYKHMRQLALQGRKSGQNLRQMCTWEVPGALERLVAKVLEFTSSSLHSCPNVNPLVFLPVAQL